MKSLPFLLACLLPLGAAAQSHTVAGRVVSAGDNAPLAGCSVVVKHTSRGTVTDPDGRYEIVAAPGDTLRFSFVGFRTAEEPVGRRTRIDVVLEAAAEAVFEECVVEVVRHAGRRRTGRGALPSSRGVGGPCRSCSPAGRSTRTTRRTASAPPCRNRFRPSRSKPTAPPMPSAAASSPRDAIPSPDAVRIEELLNYFSYDYPAPEGEDPLSLVVDAGPCPWEPSHRLVASGCVPARFRPRRFRLRISSTS